MNIKIAVVILLSVASLTAFLNAQWVNYPTTGVPMTPSGVPNLGAPAPRTADGKPDLSGIWEPENTLPCSVDDGGDNCTDLHVGEQFVNLGARLKDGLPYRPHSAQLMKARSADFGKDDPSVKCLPNGVPRTHTIPTFKKVIQVPGLIVILDEYNASYRQIFTDGRPLPEDPQPSWNGYSTGRWDGDTLVVETNGLRDGLWLDASGSPLSDRGNVTERFRRLNYGNLEIEITVDDPKEYTMPWTVKLNHFIVLNTELLDYICLEHEKDAAHMVGR